jgi:hypothetical protein
MQKYVGVVVDVCGSISHSNTYFDVTPLFSEIYNNWLMHIYACPCLIPTFLGRHKWNRDVIMEVCYLGENGHKHV